MKNSWMTRLAMSFDVPAEGGGGTATATPPAPAPAASAAPAPSSAPAPTKSGFFKDLPRAAARTAEPEKKPEAPAEVKDASLPRGTQKFRVTSDDGKSVLGEFNTQAEADAFVKAQPAPASKETPAPAPAAADALPRPLMGRFATLTEAEAAMRRSQDEGVRLSQEVKTLKEAHAKDLADREAELTALKAEFETHKATPAVKELSKEEIAALWKEDPAAAVDYVAEKKLRDRDAKAATERTKAEIQQRRENLVKSNEAIERNVDEMMKDSKTFPKFQEMLPRMSEILRRTGGEKSPLRGQVWANELAYKAALGDIYQELLAKGTETQADAAEAARLKAANDAAALQAGKGDGGGSGSARPADPVAAEDKAWREAVRASQPKPFLKDRTPKI